jgi:hypothetical protein
MDGGWARTDLEKANVFAEYLATVFTPHSQSNSNNNDNDEDIEEFLVFVYSYIVACVFLAAIVFYLTVT